MRIIKIFFSKRLTMRSLGSSFDAEPNQLQPDKNNIPTVVDANKYLFIILPYLMHKFPTTVPTHFRPE